MTIHRFRMIALLVCFATGSTIATGQTCPTSNFAVTTSLTFDKKVEDVTDEIEKLHKCFNVLGCQLTEYSVGQCGGSKTTRVAGAQKAATVQLKPGGCDTVYNCQGVYVTKETYTAIQDSSCVPYDNNGTPVGVCAGVVVPSAVLKQVWCASCHGGDWCHPCSGLPSCTTVNNCDQARRRTLLAASVPCSTVKLTITAANQGQATTIQKTLQNGIVLKQLNYCLKDLNVTSAGPTVVGPPPTV